MTNIRYGNIGKREKLTESRASTVFLGRVPFAEAKPMLEV